MSLFKKKAAVVSLVSTLVIAGNLGGAKVFADSSEVKNESTIVSSSDAKESEEKVNNVMDDFAKYIEDNNITSIDDERLDTFFNSKSSEQITGQELYSAMTDSKKQVSKMKTKNYSSEEIAETQYVKTIVANNKIRINILNNGLFTLEEMENNDNQNVNSAMLRSAKTSSARVDYRAWTGQKIFTVSAIGTFNYNGSKCTLQNGSNNSYVTRGMLSIWQVSNRSVSGGSSGTSAFAKISANLHMGIEINGVGLVIQDLYVAHKVTVSKNGTVTRSMYPGPTWTLIK